MKKQNKKLRVYVGCPIRGGKGEKATFEDMQKNCEIAKRGIDWLQERYSDIDFFCPAVHDRIVQRLSVKGFVTIHQILLCDKEEQLNCDGSLFIVWDQSDGVKGEVINCLEYKQHYLVLFGKEMDESVEEYVDAFIRGLKNGR